MSAPVIPARDSYRPVVVDVRLACDAGDLPAALAHLDYMHGEAWQPSTRKASRYGDGRVVQYGTLIVPVPRT